MINKEEYIKAREILKGEIKPFYESKLLSEIIKEEFDIEVINFYLEEIEEGMELSLIVKDNESYSKIFKDERYNRKRDEIIIKEFYKIMRDSNINLKYAPNSVKVKYYDFSKE